MQVVIDAFKVRFPLLKKIATDFKAESARLGEQVIARVSSVPSVQDYDGTTGYEANAASANEIVVDVPVTINRH